MKKVILVLVVFVGGYLLGCLNNTTTEIVEQYNRNEQLEKHLEMNQIQTETLFNEIEGLNNYIDYLEYELYQNNLYHDIMQPL